MLIWWLLRVLLFRPSISQVDSKDVYIFLLGLQYDVLWYFLALIAGGNVVATLVWFGLFSTSGKSFQKKGAVP